MLIIRMLWDDLGAFTDPTLRAISNHVCGKYPRETQSQWLGLVKKLPYFFERRYPYAVDHVYRIVAQEDPVRALF